MDRNFDEMSSEEIFRSSLSARRAWIETLPSTHCNLRIVPVALRKESVDRNKYVVQCRKVMGVALRKESVDRNAPAKPDKTA